MKSSIHPYTKWYKKIKKKEKKKMRKKKKFNFFLENQTKLIKIK